MGARSAPTRGRPAGLVVASESVWQAQRRELVTRDLAQGVLHRPARGWRASAGEGVSGHPGAMGHLKHDGIGLNEQRRRYASPTACWSDPARKEVRRLEQRSDPAFTQAHERRERRWRRRLACWATVRSRSSSSARRLSVVSSNERCAWVLRVAYPQPLVDVLGDRTECPPRAPGLLPVVPGPEPPRSLAPG
jgi:hypothetical protein